MKLLKSIILFIFISSNIFGQNLVNYNDFLSNRNKFSFNLFFMLENKNQNDIISPYFLNFSFSEIFLATKENTSLQIEHYAYFSKDKKIHSENINNYGKIIKNYDNEYININYSINLFLNDTSEVNKDFQTMLDSSISDKVILFNYAKDSLMFVNTINRTIKKNTSNTLEQAYNTEVFELPPSLIASSASYFSGKWANNFSEFIFAPFLSDSSNNTSKKIKYITTNDYFKYSESSDYQIIELPYSGYRLALLVILPKKDSSLNNIKSYFNYDLFKMWQQNMLQTQRIRLVLPQISIEKNYDIKKQIKKYTPYIFIKGGNFLNMINKLVFIKNFQHINNFNFDNSDNPKTELEYIDFQKEEDTKESYIFNANHPFLFILFDKKTKTILYLGKYCNANKT